MKHSLGSLLGGLAAALLGYCAGAAEVPEALSSGAPALTTFNDVVYLAWAGISAVGTRKSWYATFDGTWSAQTQIPGSFTTAAPALGATTQQLFLATTPPNSEAIDIYALEGAAFSLLGPLCQGNTCAQTLAAPALLGDGAVLYAAWTTPSGAVMDAEFINGVWLIAANPIPNANADPATGPALGILEDRLYVAWTEPSGEEISVISTALPLSSNSWSNPAVQVAARTDTAPALGVFTLFDSPPSQSLFLSWTTPGSRIKFAEWNTQTAQWSIVASPITLPSGALTNLAPSLNGSVFQGPNDECYYANNLAFTMLEPQGAIDFGQRAKHYKQNTMGCP
jgi:hypothetical protein